MLWLSKFAIADLKKDYVMCQADSYSQFLRIDGDICSTKQNLDSDVYPINSLRLRLKNDICQNDNISTNCNEA